MFLAKIKETYPHLKSIDLILIADGESDNDLAIYASQSLRDADFYELTDIMGFVQTEVMNSWFDRNSDVHDPDLW